MEKDTVVGHGKGSGIGDNFACMEWVCLEVVCSASVGVMEKTKNKKAEWESI